MKVYDWWDTIPNRYAKWGFGAYVFGHIIKILIFIPVFFIDFMIIETYIDLKKGYEKSLSEFKQKTEEAKP